MAFRLTWSPTARRDLADIHAYLAESHPDAAKHFIRAIFQSAERLAGFPDSARIVPEFNEPDIREIIRRPFRIVCRIRRKDRLVEIVRIWHAARGIPEV